MIVSRRHYDRGRSPATLVRVEAPGPTSAALEREELVVRAIAASPGSYVELQRRVRLSPHGDERRNRIQLLVALTMLNGSRVTLTDLTYSAVG